MTRAGAKRGATNAYCNRCRIDTNHDILAAYRAEYEGGCEIYELLKCRGCDMVKMRVTDKYIDDETQNETQHIVYYPRSIARRAPEWMEISLNNLGLDIPGSVYRLMRQIYAAVQNDLHGLAAMGIRAVLKNVMRDKVGNHQYFKDLVIEFQKAGYLSTREAGTLETILESGHATIHRDWEPTEWDITTLLDITESIVETVYIHELHAKSLEKRVPRRR